MASFGEHQKKGANGRDRSSSTPRKYSSNFVSEHTIERIRLEDESDLEKVYHMGEVLGRGSFGIVKEVRHKESGEKYAMKVIHKDKV